jgi:hypothetical protein
MQAARDEVAACNRVWNMLLNTHFFLFQFCYDCLITCG